MKLNKFTKVGDIKINKHGQKKIVGTDKQGKLILIDIPKILF